MILQPRVTVSVAVMVGFGSCSAQGVEVMGQAWKFEDALAGTLVASTASLAPV